MKKVIFIIIIIGLVAFAVYQGFLKEEEPEFSLFEVSRGNVVQEVLETGQVQTGEILSLGFRNAGRIERIYVEVGDKVEAGVALAKIETTQLIIELAEAQATLAISQAELDKLLAGSTAEEIQLAQTVVDNAEIALEDARQDAEEDLNQAYEDALNTLDSSYLKGDGALTTVTSVQRTYFVSNDQESITVREKKSEIENNLSEAKEYIDLAKSDSSNENVDAALSNLKNSLSNIYNALGVIRNMTEVIDYRDTVSATDKTSLETKRLNVNTALTNIINSQQTIASTRLTGETSVNSAQGALRKAQDELRLEKAEPRQVDIDLYEAQVRRARAQVELLENQIWEATLRSPVRGQIAEMNKKIGETVQPVLAESVITLLPVSPYEIKVDIYEEDIIKMEVGNAAEIFLIALPDESFKGEVISISPAEKLIEGVVYYEVTIDFEESPQGIKPGMTVDLVIKAASKENVLVVPEEAIQEKDGKNIVQVFKDNQIEDREIEVGLIGSDDMVEIIAGLEEGEEVVVE